MPGKKETKNQKAMRENKERKERESTEAAEREASEETPSGQPESSSAAQQGATSRGIFQPRDPGKSDNITTAKWEAQRDGLWDEIKTITDAAIYSPGDSQMQSAITAQSVVTAKEDMNVIENKKDGKMALGLLSNTIKVPLRTGYGGIPQLPCHYLLANYFHLEVQPKRTIHQYSVKVEEKIKRKKRRLFTLLLEHESFKALVDGRNLHKVATDYNNTIYTADKLKIDQPIQLKIDYHEVEEVGSRAVPKTYDIAVTPIDRIEMQDLVTYLDGTLTLATAEYDEAPATRALNTILAKTAYTTRDVYTTGENKFYRYPDPNDCLQHCTNIQTGCMTLGKGLIAVRGYYASVRTSTQRLLVNVHTQSSAFYAAVNVLDLQRFHRPDHPLFDLQVLENFLRKLRVRTDYMRERVGDDEVKVEKVKTILGLSKLSPSELQFVNENGAKESVAEFFKRRHGKILEYPEEGFCLKVGEIKKDKDGKDLAKDKYIPIWLPPELCDVMPGQVYPKKLDAEQTKRMVAYAARPPQENVSRLLNHGLKILGLHSDERNKTLDAFRMIFKPALIAVPARILPYPVLKYTGTEAKTGLGKWNMLSQKTDSAGKNISRKFWSPKPMPTWCYLLVDYVKSCHNSTVNTEFDETLCKALDDYGLGKKGKQSERTIVWNDRDRNGSDQNLERVMTKARIDGIELFVVILPNTRADVFGRIKFWADIKCGMHTVCCLKEKTGKKATEMFCANLALKINAKLGGTNHKYGGTELDALKTTMMVGIDVTHPSSNSLKQMPSIAGVVASHDECFSQWPGSIRCQTQKYMPGTDTWKPQEMVQELREMIEERLRLYRKKNRGRLPENILVYRDGVSESQYKQVLEEELPQIEEACRPIYRGGVIPKITIVVVGKRHHTRFYATDKAHADEKLKNPRAGTVVNRGVTMLYGCDFFLQPHAALTGTAKPGHYIVIKNDMLLTAKQFETITNTLCYLYVRATMAVSVCPPAYYADLLCERGRCYLWEDFNAGPKRQGDEDAFDANRAAWLRDVDER